MAIPYDSQKTSSVQFPTATPQSQSHSHSLPSRASDHSPLNTEKSLCNAFTLTPPTPPNHTASRFHSTFSSISPDRQQSSVSSSNATSSESPSTPASLFDSAAAAAIGNGEETECIFVGNLPKRYTKIQLEKIVRHLFSSYGPVAYTKASMDRQGRPYCFVKFFSIPIPRQCLTDALVLDSRTLRVEVAKGQPARTGSSSNVSQLNSKPTFQSDASGRQQFTNHSATDTRNASGRGILSSVWQHQDRSYNSTMNQQYSMAIPERPASCNALDNYGTAYQLTDRMSSFSLDPNTLSSYSACYVPARDAFDAQNECCIVRVAGLNAVFVTDPLVQKYFEKYGRIAAISLVTCSCLNFTEAADDCRHGTDKEGCKGCYALIRYEDHLCARRAVFNEDGNIWLGSRIEVTIERMTESPKGKFSTVATRPSCCTANPVGQCMRAVTPPAQVRSCDGYVGKSQQVNPFISFPLNSTYLSSDYDLPTINSAFPQDPLASAVPFNSRSAIHTAGSCTLQSSDTAASPHSLHSHSSYAPSSTSISASASSAMHSVPPGFHSFLSPYSATLFEPLGFDNLLSANTPSLKSPTSCSVLVNSNISLTDSAGGLITSTSAASASVFALSRDEKGREKRID